MRLYPAGDDLAASGRAVLDDGDVEVAECGHCKCSRDGRCGHDEAVRGFVLSEHCTLVDAEFVLFVDDDQAEVREIYILLEQCDGSDDDVDLAGGQAAARQTGLSLLATVQAQLGSIDRIKRVIKSLGFVNSTNDFAEQPLVINGYSELYRDIFGDENGVGARSAIGTSILPGNIPVEIEVIFEIES